MFPTPNPLHDELISVLKHLFPYTSHALFLKTGSEAVSAAIRLARAFSGKTRIIRCGFHGWHDSVVNPVVSWHSYETDPQLPRQVVGIPYADSETLTLTWDGEDLQQLVDLLQTHHAGVAALLLDPVQLREPLAEHLQQIRQITREEGVLLILDEIKTGFRVNLAGVQGLYGIEPDISIFSKAISNGFPLSVVIANQEILNLSANTRIMGTYNNELLSVVAALKTVSILARSGNIDWLWKIGQEFINGVNEILTRYDLMIDIEAVAYRWPCMPYIWFRNTSETAQRLKPKFYSQIVQRGLLLLPNHMNFVCLAHTADDVEKALQIIEDAFKEIIG